MILANEYMESGMISSVDKDSGEAVNLSSGTTVVRRSSTDSGYFGLPTQVVLSLSMHLFADIV